MNGFKNKLILMMRGRNGFDYFSKDLTLLSLFLVVLDFIVPGDILQCIGLALIVYSYFRAFSRNISKRYGENLWYYQTIGNPLRSYIKRDRKNYRYFKCPTCGQTLRAPKGKGKIRVNCSKCHNMFEKKV